MFLLKKVSKDKFQIHGRYYDSGFEGDPDLIFKWATAMGVKQNELFIALGEMCRNFHDFAEFDTYGRFVRSGTTYRSTGSLSN